MMTLSRLLGEIDSWLLTALGRSRPLRVADQISGDGTLKSRSERLQNGMGQGGTSASPAERWFLPRPLSHRHNAPTQDVVVAHIYSTLSLFLVYPISVQYSLTSMRKRGKHKKGG